MTALLIMGLCVTGVAIPILAYNMGYRGGKSAGMEQAVSDLRTIDFTWMMCGGNFKGTPVCDECKRIQAPYLKLIKGGKGGD